MQSAFVSSGHVHTTVKVFFAGLFPLPIVLLLFACGIWSIVLLLLKLLHGRREVTFECDVVRSVTGTFYRSSFYHRFYENSKCEHTGILLNSALLNIRRHIQGLPSKVANTKTDPRGAGLEPGRQFVLFLFDPLRSDAELVLGSSCFEPTGFFCECVALREFNLREELPRYAVSSLPTCGEWMVVGDGVEVTYQRCRKDERSAQRVDHILHLRARGPDAERRLERFVEQSLQEYIADLPRTSGGQRYHFQLVGGEETLRFTKQVLTTCKTLETMFFPQKDELLMCLERFMKKEGRFAVDGFPYKLGFLVCGESGVGKTALVSAIAAHTHRHVISLRLPLISTDQQLHDIFLGRTLSCTNDFRQFSYELEDVIILFEDVDVKDDVVHSRLLSAGEKKDGGNEFACYVSTPASFCPQERLGLKAPSLSGFLNVIDGVVDVYSLIVVMITRDPSGIDSALLRPGRFGYRIHMKNMGVGELMGFLGLYFGTELRSCVEADDRKTTQRKRSCVDTQGEVLFRLSKGDEEKVCRCIESLGRDDFSINGGIAESICMHSNTLSEFLMQLVEWHRTTL